MNREHVKQLAQQQAQIIGSVNILGGLLTRGFFGRFKWLLLGR